MVGEWWGSWVWLVGRLADFGRGQIHRHMIESREMDINALDRQLVRNILKTI